LVTPTKRLHCEDLGACIAHANSLIKVLYIDIEGGHGGSSQSLRILVENLDRSRINPVIWHRRDNGYGSLLDGLCIRHRHETRIASIIPRASKNWKNWLISLPRFIGLWNVAKEILHEAPDIIHLNYEGLVPLLALLGCNENRPSVVLHFRTKSPPNWVYRQYAKIINRNADYLVFISENERKIANRAGVETDRLPGRVLYNPVKIDPKSKISQTSLGPPRPMNLVFLGTLDNIRAADRLIPLAAELKRQNVNARIHAYGGSPGYRKFLIFPRKTLERLRNQVEAANLEPWIKYCGRTEDPRNALAMADLLLWPSRENNPWGRSILEAMAQGVPVMAVGKYDKFVSSGETGYLFDHWDPDVWAKTIKKLEANRSQLTVLSRNATAKVAGLCDPDRYAEQMMQIYDRLLADARP
jgi:glycosyltransferase involved in cell wall biosynthesis